MAQVPAAVPGFGVEWSRPRAHWCGFALAAATAVCLLVAAPSGANGLATMAAIPLAAFLSSIAGFAFSPICGAMLFPLMGDAVHTMQILLVCSIANQVAMVCSLRREIDWSGLPGYVAAGLGGVCIGVWLLLHVARGYYQAGLGALLVAYGAAMLFRKPVVVRKPWPAVDCAAAFLGGIAGGAVSFPGAFLIIWSGMKGWSKAQQRAFCQPFILIMQLAALAVLTVARGGHFETHTLLLIPASLLGTMGGLAVFRRLSDLSFARAVNALLLAVGLCYLL